MATKNNGEQVEYIETDGGCAIQTDILWKTTMGCQISIYRPNTSVQNRIVFVRNASNANYPALQFSFSEAGKLWNDRYRGGTSQIVEWTFVDKIASYYKIYCDCDAAQGKASYYNVNATIPYTLADLLKQASVKFSSSSFPGVKNVVLTCLALFGGENDTIFTPAGVRIYGVVLWDGDDGTTLTNPSHLLVPWKDASGQYCIKDIATEKIYYNIGNGTLTGA